LQQKPTVQRTLVALDLLGKLDLYHAVFNLNDYRKHRSTYFGLVLGGWKDDHYMQELYHAIKRDNIHVPFGACLYGYLLAIFRHCPEFIKRPYGNLKRHRLKSS
jgi:hypothetical protein